MKVSYGVEFARILVHLGKVDREKVRVFEEHVIQHGLAGLPGRNKNSNSVSTKDHNFVELVKFAQQYNLWHYHIGIPKYDTAVPGDQTSEYIIHYQLLDDEVHLVDFDSHSKKNPFKFPKPEHLRSFPTMASISAREEPAPEVPASPKPDIS